MNDNIEVTINKEPIDNDFLVKRGRGRPKMKVQCVYCSQVFESKVLGLIHIYKSEESKNHSVKKLTRFYEDSEYEVKND